LPHGRGLNSCNQAALKRARTTSGWTATHRAAGPTAGRTTTAASTTTTAGKTTACTSGRPPEPRPGECLQSAHHHPAEAGRENPLDGCLFIRKCNGVELDIVLYYLPPRFIEIVSDAAVVVYIADQHQDAPLTLGRLFKKTE
jgi:hypothetical protein